MFIYKLRYQQKLGSVKPSHSVQFRQLAPSPLPPSELCRNVNPRRGYFLGCHGPPQRTTSLPAVRESSSSTPLQVHCDKYLEGPEFVGFHKLPCFVPIEVHCTSGEAAGCIPLRRRSTLDSQRTTRGSSDVSCTDRSPSNRVGAHSCTSSGPSSLMDGFEHRLKRLRHWKIERLSKSTDSTT